MKGKLIVIDGLDGAGKATQSKLLVDHLNKLGKPASIVSFPSYGHDSAHMVESYLQGKFGEDPNMVDAYTASSFYSIDRSLTFKYGEFGSFYNNGGIIIADRYINSNVIHQGSKIIDNILERDIADCAFDEKFISFINWIFDLEINRFGIPKPDMIIFLESSERSNHKMIDSRNEKNDIHEKNYEYLEKCRKTLRAYKYLYTHYIDLCPILKSIPNRFINVSDGDDEYLPKEVIHEVILELTSLAI